MIMFSRLEHFNDDKFKNFHNTLFAKTSASQEWFRWFFSLNRSDYDNLPRVYVAREDNQIIGVWCVEPKDFQYNNSMIKVGRCFSVGVHPDYRRRNIFVDLSTYAIEQERSLKQFEYIMGFPQEGKSVVGGHIKSGWERTQTIDVWNAWKFPVVKPENSSLYHVHPISDFKSIKNTQYNNSFIDSSLYKNSRWLNHPDCFYVCLVRDESYIVLKTYGSVCHVLDINGTHEHVRHLLRVTKTLADRHNFHEVTIWCAENDYHIEDVKSEFSFGSSGAVSPVELLSVKINAKNSLKFSDTVHFNMGCEEIY